MTEAAFVYDPPSTRVVFGAGTVSRLGEEMTELGVRRALVIATPGRASQLEPIVDVLGVRAVSVFTGARMHVPAALVGEVEAVAARHELDCYVTLGGGSTIGLAKALALRRPLPIVAVPTTYSGSEMTPIYGITLPDGKQTGRDRRVVPRLVIYDPVQTAGLPAATSAASGMNALAHAVEGLYAPERVPVVDWMAEEAIRALGEALPRIVAGASGLGARTRALEGAWLAGSVLGASAMGLHHKLCHVLGGSFDLPHAETHAVLLPYVAAYNAPYAKDAMAKVARALGAADAVDGLVALGRALGIPPSLAALGMHRRDVATAARAALHDRYANPRPLDEAEITGLLRAAFEGAPPPR